MARKGIGSTSIQEITDTADVGFGLHIMDFLMAPGWKDDGYPRDLRY